MDLSRNSLHLQPPGQTATSLSTPPELAWLSLANNGLRSLPAMLLAAAGPRGLRTLDLSANSLADLPAPVLKALPALARLDVGANQLWEVPVAGMVAVGPTLRHLSLCENKITDVSGWLGALENLEVLDLRGNILAEGALGVAMPPRLRRLNVASNLFRRLPESLLDCAHLEVLIASHCRLGELPVRAVAPPALRHLDVSHNSLVVIPGWVGRSVNCPAWSRACAATDCVLSLFRCLRQLRAPRLAVLVLAHNNISELPAGEGELQVTHMDASFNRIRALPDGLVGAMASTLRRLDLRSNVLELLPRSIVLCENLVRLRLTNNPRLMHPPLETAGRGARAVRAWMRSAQSSRVEPALCTAQGAGVERVQAGEHAGLFEIHATDAEGAPCTRGGEDFVVRLRRVGGDAEEGADAVAEAVGTVYDLHNGLYSVVYTVTRAGRYLCSVTLRGEHINASPFDVAVVPSGAFAFSTRATGTGLFGGVAGERAMFLLESRDEFDNRIMVGGERFDVAAIPFSKGGKLKLDAIQPAQVLDNHDGTYSVLYQTPAGAKEYQVVAKLRNINVRGSPFQCSVVKSSSMVEALVPVTKELHAYPSIQDLNAPVEPSPRSYRASSSYGGSISGAKLIAGDELDEFVRKLTDPLVPGASDIDDRSSQSSRSPSSSPMRSPRVNQTVPSAFTDLPRFLNNLVRRAPTASSVEAPAASSSAAVPPLAVRDLGSPKSFRVAPPVVTKPYPVHLGEDRVGGRRNSEPPAPDKKGKTPVAARKKSATGQTFASVTFAGLGDMDLWSPENVRSMLTRSVETQVALAEQNAALQEQLAAALQSQSSAAANQAARDREVTSLINRLEMQRRAAAAATPAGVEGAEGDRFMRLLRLEEDVARVSEARERAEIELRELQSANRMLLIESQRLVTRLEDEKRAHSAASETADAAQRELHVLINRLGDLGAKKP